jgi:hypothetical protein
MQIDMIPAFYQERTAVCSAVKIWKSYKIKGTIDYQTCKMIKDGSCILEKKNS